MYCFCLPCAPCRSSALPLVMMNCFGKHIVHAPSILFSTTSARRTIESGPCFIRHVKKDMNILSINICRDQTADTVEVSAQESKYDALRNTYHHRGKDAEGWP
jgi:hypothetical protein